MCPAEHQAASPAELQAWYSAARQAALWAELQAGSPQNCKGFLSVAWPWNMGFDWDRGAPPGQASPPTSPTTPYLSQSHGHCHLWPAERQAASGAELQAACTGEHQASLRAELKPKCLAGPLLAALRRAAAEAHRAGVAPGPCWQKAEPPPRRSKRKAACEGNRT